MLGGVDELLTRVHARLGVDAADMRLRSVVGDDQRLADGLRIAAAQHKLEHFALACSEVVIGREPIGIDPGPISAITSSENMSRESSATTASRTTSSPSDTDDFGATASTASHPALVILRTSLSLKISMDAATSKNANTKPTMNDSEPSISASG